MRFMVTCTDTFYRRLKSVADAAGMNISEFVRYCINRYLDDAKRNGVK